MSDSTAPARQTVVTGVGIMSPIGIGADAFWDSISNRRSGVAPFEICGYTAAPQNAGGEVRDFTDSAAKKGYLKSVRKSIKVMCREIQLGVASAMQALEHSGLNLDEIDHHRMGVDFGANLMFSPPEVLQDAAWRCVTEGDESRAFHYDQWGQVGLAAMEPLWLLRYLPNMPACHIGIAADARGPNNSITQDEASGNLVMSEASRIIERGHADVMISGTTGTRVHPVKTMHVSMWDQLASNPGSPATWCRPFDRDRSGEVVAEGSCSFILEDESHAVARGAKIYGRILGGGASCVIDRAGNADLRRALALAAVRAIADAGLEPGDIGHVNAHGCGDRERDAAEAAAILDVFGSDTNIPVTAVKSYMGNSGSGSGPIEVAASLLALQHGVIPATLNYSSPDESCPIRVVSDEPLTTDNKVFLKLSVTRIGQASAIVVSA